MSIWCSACQCYVRTPCTSHHQSRSSFYRRFRSTKGASKARRDHINSEIRVLRSLMPISADDQDRLSYLHSMAAVCTYIRKSVLLQGLSSEGERRCPVPYETFLEALHGFVLVVSAQGRLVYVSENVEQYLGISMVDVLQGDSVFDMVEPSDLDVVKSNLDLERHPSPDRSFVCAMQTSKAFKIQHGGCCSMLVRGRFQIFPSSSSSSSPSSSSQPVFVALCSPTVNRLRPKDAQLCQNFSSTHRLDMSFNQVSDSVLHYLGFSCEEITNTSWYGLVHPEDLSHSAQTHKTLAQADEGFHSQMVLRLQRKDQSWSWVYIRATRTNQSISCSNYIISETEARFLQQKVDGECLGTSDSSCQPPPQLQTSNSSNPKSIKCLKRRRASETQCCERQQKRRSTEKMRSDSEPDCVLEAFPTEEADSPGPVCTSPALFTPPYTPDSSPCSSSVSQHDVFMDVLSSPDASPCYFTAPTPIACGQSPSQSNVAPLNHAQQPEITPLDTFNPLNSPYSSSPSPISFEDPFPARLVPDCFSVLPCQSPAESTTLHLDEYAFAEQPPEGSVTTRHVPEMALPVHLLTPNQSPTAHGTFEYSEREREEISILAQQISSLASSFDVFRSARSSSADVRESAGFKIVDPVLDDCVFDSIFRDLDLVSGKSGFGNGVGASSELEGQSLSAENLDVSVSQNYGLHQLDQYIHSGLQRDAL